MKSFLLAAVGGLCLSWGVVCTQTTYGDNCESGCGYSENWYINDFGQQNYCWHFPNDMQARTGRVIVVWGKQCDYEEGMINRVRCPKANCDQSCDIVNATWIDSSINTFFKCAEWDPATRSDCIDEKTPCNL